MASADTAENRLQAKEFYERVTAKDYPDDKLIGACKTIYANMKAHPNDGWRDVLYRYHLYIITEKNNDPELMLAFIKDTGIGPVLASSCLRDLFSDQHRDCPDIGSMQREGAAAFLTNIPAYGKLSKIWDEQGCIYYYAEGIPIEFHDQYGLKVTWNEYRIEDQLSELFVTIVYNGKKYFY